MANTNSLPRGVEVETFDVLTNIQDLCYQALLNMKTAPLSHKSVYGLKIFNVNEFLNGH